ncbi:hypothetical protein DYB25_004210 [Aphanomyces astaci]|uniref:MULE transposase domain-containing protein n=3 Tax=Aphanomyces astaci TaxID=112090 RepID=A0A397BF53_APHAT|nr:hypothetical protein DYB25_004210 [Aphanomyces astaci]
MLPSLSSLLQHAVYGGNTGATRFPVPSRSDDGHSEPPFTSFGGTRNTQQPPLRLPQAPLLQHRLWHGGAVGTVGSQADTVEVEDDGSLDCDDNDAWDIFDSINWDIGGVDEVDISSNDGSSADEHVADRVVVVAEAMAKHTRKKDVYDWAMVGEFESYTVAKDSVAPSCTQSTKKTKCTVCLGPGVHEVCMRYMKCTCREQCTKQLRVLTCSTSKRAVVYKRGQYGDCEPPRPGTMSRSIRDQADRLFAEGITPSRAQHRLKSVVPAHTMPRLKTFQSRCRYYRLSTLGEHSKPSVMARLLVESKIDDGRDSTTFFSFGFEVVEGIPHIGYGGTSGVFKVGITTKQLLHGMNRDPSSFVFHWDATYKINSMAYPVLICGMTDPGGNFHPVAFFIIGEESTDEYEWAMRELMTVYEAVVGSPLKLHYVMGDAAKAPIAALKNLPQLGIKTLLMCFYHCVACVNKRLGGAPKQVKALVSKHMFKMHFSRSEFECQQYWEAAKVAWSACEVLVAKDFARYFEEQWFSGDTANWQAYHTPSGFPTTNNPCELFNKHFKGLWSIKLDLYFSST